MLCSISGFQDRTTKVPGGARGCQAISQRPDQSARECQQVPHVAPLLLHKPGGPTPAPAGWSRLGPDARLGRAEDLGRVSRYPSPPELRRPEESAGDGAAIEAWLWWSCVQ